VHISCLIFVVTRLSKDDVAGKRVLEIGSYDINGSARKCIEFWQPAEYIGVDIEEGPGVDLVCDAAKLVDIFPEESFDVVFSTELLEHVPNPKAVISNMKRLCKRNGTILITTRSRGFFFHPFPYDFWRFELSDMQTIFSDCEIIDLEEDFSDPGVFVKVEKPSDFVERDLSRLELYNVALGKRLTEMTVSDSTFKLKLRVLACIVKTTVYRSAFKLFFHFERRARKRRGSAPEDRREVCDAGA
jgi:SAM-dependent methyltransferase